MATTNRKTSAWCGAAAAAVLFGCLLLAAPVAQAQGAAATGAAEPRPLIEPGKIKLPVPRSVQAATALLGLGRPRLALVIGNPSIDRKTLLPAAARDTQAVAAALRAGGFVVMVREDLSAAELRANLNEFRQRLEPESVAVVYFSGVGGQLAGKNVVLGRHAQIDPAAPPPALAEAWGRGGVPIAELVNALEGPPSSPRVLVVDAGVELPQLGRLAQPGLIEQTLPPGLMAIFSAAPNGVLQAPPAPAALPSPAPTDPRAIAASRFGRELVRSLLTPGLSAPDVLRLTRRGVSEQSGGKQIPWIGGDTDANEELAEAKLLDAILPSSPEELAKDVAKQALQESALARRGANPGTNSTTSQAPGNTAGPSERGRPETPSSSAPARAANSALDLATAAAATAATVAIAAKAAEASAVVNTAAAATGVATAAAETVGNVAARATPLSALRPAAPAPAPAPAATTPPVAPAAGPVVARASPAPQRPSAPLFDIPPDPRTERRQEGGERAPFVPQVNPFGYAQGDTFTYRVIDGWKGQVAGSFVQAIDGVLADGMLNANGSQLQLDPQGRTVSQVTPAGRQEFQPFQDHWWNNPKRGESRDVNFREFYNRADRKGEIEWKGDMSVGRPRSIELPAGKFDVVPIHGDGWYYETSSAGKGSGRWNRTVWYSPKLGHPVAIDIEDTDWAGKLSRRERVELVHAQKAKP